MAQDSEKRFHSIMDKLFHHAPKTTQTSSSSVSGAQASRGKKCPNTSTALASVDPKTRADMVERSQHSVPTRQSEAPLCRPWDQGDLMRRLATHI
ncbi:hypothetical protein HS088_TW20G00617 [Tripterygium wilfordii]|uniref:Uncharacterized protein n=1 Tax=Tripterygium wilfordii TaxID=458696 RepID=A0A7J7C7X8_TRIWF|nr:hypothetical protein HS088_TW20G00617 [Tripterygium wilfordii]